MRILSLIAVVVFVSSLAAPARAGMAEDCVQESDPDLGISGCTAAIRSGQWQGESLTWAYNNRAGAYLRLGEYRRAIQDSDTTLRLDPGNSIAYLNRGLAYHALLDYRRAIQDFDQAIRLDPNNAIAYFGRGDAYAREASPGWRACSNYARARDLQADALDDDIAGVYDSPLARAKRGTDLVGRRRPVCIGRRQVPIQRLAHLHAGTVPRGLHGAPGRVT